jgi:hypothetical protein
MKKKQHSLFPDDVQFPKCGYIREDFVWVHPADMGDPPKMYNLRDLELADRLESIVKDINSWMMKKYDNDLNSFDGEITKRIQEVISKLREPIPPPAVTTSSCGGESMLGTNVSVESKST